MTLPSICEVWRMLGGGALRHGRGRAFWRDGDGLSVALDDAKGVWFDHRDATGGGVLDLIAHARGGNRADSLRWLSETLGVPLVHQNPYPVERVQRSAALREIPIARLWRIAFLDLIDSLLVDLKAALFDPTLPAPNYGEILALERMRAAIHGPEDFALVGEYRWWRERSPHFTGAMVSVGRRIDGAQRGALREFIRRMAHE